MVLRSFIKGSFWAVYGNVVVKGISLIASVFIAKLLGNVSFGELAIIKTTLSVFSLLAAFGLGITITKFVAESRDSDIEEIGKIIPAANRIIVATGSFLGLMLMLLAPYISHYVLNADNLSIPLRIAAIYLVFNALNVYQIGVISGLEAFRQLARINLVMGIITLPIMLCTTLFWGLNGTLLGLTINVAINWLLNRRLILKITTKLKIPLYSNNLRPTILQLLKFSYPLAIKEIIYSISNWGIFYLLLLQTNYGEVGIYNSANQLSQLILFIPGSISSVFLSVLSKQSNNYYSYMKLIKRNIIFSVTITTVIGIIIILMSKFIYQFYGSTYSGGEDILFILVIATVPMSLIGVFEKVFISNSKPKQIAFFKLISQGLIILIMLVFFYFEKSASSLAYSVLIGYSIIAAIMYLKIPKRAKKYIKPIT